MSEPRSSDSQHQQAAACRMDQAADSAGQLDEQQMAVLTDIARQAGLSDVDEHDFAAWLQRLPQLATGCKQFTGIRTLEQQRSELRKALHYISSAISVIEGPLWNHFQKCHFNWCLHNPDPLGQPLTNDDLNGLEDRYSSDLNVFKQWEEILESNLQSLAQTKPNSDELAKSKPALRPDEALMLEFLVGNWCNRFGCHTALGKTSLLVRFCVEVFRAVGWHLGSSEPYEAMRKRLGTIVKRVRRPD